MRARRLRLALGLLLLAGCCHQLPDQTDGIVMNLAGRPTDIEPIVPAAQPAPEQAPPPRRADDKTEQSDLPPWDRTILPAAYQEEKPARKPRRELTLPPDLPGSGVPPLRLPRGEEARNRALEQIYPPLPPLPPGVPVVPGPEGRPLTLSDLQHIARLHNPSIKNAIAGVEAARGAMVQAGAYPNPSLVYAADTLGTGGGGYQGGGFDQPIKGANKLRLQEAMAAMDLRNAVVTLRRAQTDLATQVRSNYFAVLVAAENVRLSRALAHFTDEIFRIQLDLVRAGEGAPYEPMQLRPLAYQARFNLIQALNQYKASWLQLAAAIGVPDMCPTELAGRVDLPVPAFCYDDVLKQVLARDTDVLTAENSLQRARYALELAQVTPFPDFDVRVLLQKDYTTGPSIATHALVYTGEISFPVPVWDQNKGAIHQAHNQLIQATLQPQQTRLNLTNTLVDAFNRYVTNREQVAITGQQLRDQVRVFPMLYRRHQLTVVAGAGVGAGGEVLFPDVVAALQTLVGYTSAYVTALGLQWTAVVDVANVLQTDDLFGVAPCEAVTPLPDLEELLQLPEPVRGVPHPAPGAVAGEECDKKPDDSRDK